MCPRGIPAAAGISRGVGVESTKEAFSGWTVYRPQMVLDDLGSSLRSTLDTLQGKTRLSEEDVEEVVTEIQRSLLSADVDVDLVMALSESIRERALGEEPPAGTTAKDHVLKIVYEEMVCSSRGSSVDSPTRSTISS